MSETIKVSTIPLTLIEAEGFVNTSDFLADNLQIQRYYKIYKEGASFDMENTEGKYIPTELHYKIAATLINKQARFLFAEPPDIVIEPGGNIGTLTEHDQEAIQSINNLVRAILDENNFEEILIKAAKDCFIGKRVAGIVNFNEETGVTMSFIPSTQFIYQTDFCNFNQIMTFVYFKTIFYSHLTEETEIYKKKYTLEEGGVFVEEAIYTGSGQLKETILEKQLTALSVIPVAIFLNDGLTGDRDGESEIELLEDFESLYSKLSNADTDSGRFNMNPIRYTVNMNENSTKNLPNRPGAYWDLSEDQGQDRGHAMIGTLENSMNYSDALKTTLDRIKTSAYEQVDMPNVSIETMRGTITSGKSLKAIYWSLIVRCKEKMKVWAPQIRRLMEVIIDGSYVYPNCITRYAPEPLTPIEYEVKVVQNHPLPEDEIDEMQVDLQNVEAKTMSKKAYMQKWRGLTDEQVNEELEQIALERQIIEDFAFNRLPEVIVEDE